METCKMLLCCFILFFILSNVSAQDLDTTDGLLIQTWNIKVDKNCIEKNYTLKFYNEKLISAYEQCIADATKRSGITQQSLRSMTPVDIATATVCLTPNPVECSEIILNSIQKCLSKAQRDFLQYKKAQHAVSKSYSCENNGKRFKDFLNVDDTKCSQRDVQRQKLICDAMRHSINEIRYEDQFTEDTCLKKEKLVRCESDAHNSCEDKAQYNYYRQGGYLNLYETPCKQYASADISLPAVKVLPTVSLPTIKAPNGCISLSILKPLVVFMLFLCTYSSNFMF